MKIDLPAQVNTALTTLERAGYQAYIVGGCVRDTIRGNTPEDWDLCTSARPQEILEVFKDYKTIPTGLKHGTVTVVINHLHLEITTYRIDGDYSDNRHPDQVHFTTNIEEDLARRDFTINAMAYSPKHGLVDPFGGRNHIKVGLIESVGQASSRFAEDGLRIMRGLRFASVLGFDIEEETGKAMIEGRHLLKNIAQERINVELCKFMVGQKAEPLLMKYRDVFAEVIPEIEASFDFDQKNYHHIYDVWTHTVKSVSAAPEDEVVRLAMLFHDLGKPQTFTIDEKGIGHFYGHVKVSEEITRNILNRLRFDNERKKQILLLVANHDIQLAASRRSLKRLLGKMGQDNVEKLLQVKRADCLAQAPEFQKERLDLIEECKNIIEEIIEEEQCFSLGDLDIDGNDLIENGFSAGPQLGQLLNQALEAVIEEEISNKKSEILRFLEKSNKKS